MEQKPAMDVTVSGMPVSYYRLPGGGTRSFVNELGVSYSVWKAEPPRVFKLNALAVETFQKQTYPVVKVSIKEKTFRGSPSSGIKTGMTKNSMI